MGTNCTIMGGSDEKPAPNKPAPPDLTETLINMKMKSKTFLRQAEKALEEKKKYYETAKQHLKKGNQEGAQMYLELCNQKDQENKQMIRMGVRLETLAVQIKAKNISVDMVNNLDAITPILEMEAHGMPIEQMYGKLERFNQAYDDLTIKGNILDDGLSNQLSQPGQQKDVNHMMQGLQAEVAMEMGVQPTMDMTMPQQNQQTNANQGFYDDLKNI